MQDLQTGLTQATMNALSQSSANTNAASTLSRTISDPPTQADMQALADKIDEMILALRRSSGAAAVGDRLLFRVSDFFR
jgi:hypothetical protein